MSGIWGPLTIETDVDVAILVTLKKWMPLYLAQAERERALTVGTLARPNEASFQNTLESDEFPDARLPAVIVTTAKMDNLEVDGDGLYRCGWRVALSLVVRGRHAREARAAAALFGSVAGRILVQQEDLGGFATGVKPLGGTLAPVDDETDKGRYLAASMRDYIVFTDGVMQAGAGPHDLPDPYEPPDLEQPDEPWDPITSVGAVTVSVVEKES